MDWSGKAAPGTIAISDPKMYRREALINERNRDVVWIDDMLDKSGTIEFKPEIAREIETITSLSAALGLSFDPAAGLNYRRDQKTGDLKQQIDAMRLQLQLDQLKRDADLFRSKLETQTDPVNTDLGKIGDPGVPPASSGVSAAAADQLKAAIDKLNAALVGRLDADGKPAAAPANVGVNPSDLFRDRAAYRDTLKAARNAASLDELHDFGGSALIRLNFQATILPDRQRASIPGVVQMRVVTPQLSSGEQLQIYRGWLQYINKHINISNGSGWTTNSDLLGSDVIENFDLVRFSYAPAAGAPANSAPPRAARGAKSKTAPAARTMGPSTCSGLVVDTDAPAEPGCATLTFAVPKFLGTSSQEGAATNLAEYRAFILQDPAREMDHYNEARSTLATNPASVVAGCEAPRLPSEGPGRNLYNELLRARAIAAGGSVLAEIDRIARRMLSDDRVAPPDEPKMALIAMRAARSDAMLRTFEQFAYPANCTDRQRTAFRTSGAVLFIPPRFNELLARDTGRVAVYDIGPREQSQQISTVARAANSLSLAVSIAAAAPGSGAAANAAAGYSRQAMGRAAELERLPAVVGYSVTSSRTFGWVVGPRASVDPKGKITLDQSLRSYDLSVDLSVPGWWPYFCLQSITAWAAHTRDISDAALDVPPKNGAKEECASESEPSHGDSSDTLSKLRMTRVSMSPNDSDYAWLTAYIGYGDVEERRTASLDDRTFSNQFVSACRPTTLIARGPSIWRTGLVIIGGAKIPPASVSVAPDMSGIVIDVPALDDTLGADTSADVTIRLLTPYNVVDGTVTYRSKPGGGCRTVDKPQKPAPNGPSVSSPAPKTSSVPADLPIQVSRSKLDRIDGAILAGQSGSVDVSGKGRGLKITFARDETASIARSRSVPLVLLRGDKAIVEKAVEVTANNGGR